LDKKLNPFFDPLIGKFSFRLFWIKWQEILLILQKTKLDVQLSKMLLSC